MKTTAEYKSLLSNYMQHNAQNYGISRAGIFGSVARGEHTADSDVDICFESAPIGLFTLGKLKNELETLLDCNVDLLRFHRQLDGTYFKKIVNQEMISVYGE